MPKKIVLVAAAPELNAQQRAWVTRRAKAAAAAKAAKPARKTREPRAARLARKNAIVSGKPAMGPE